MLKLRFLAVLLATVFALPVVAQAADARLQVIHNAADPAAAVVDIYVNDALFEDDFSFREATEYRTVPAGVQLNVQIAPGNSSSSAEAIATIPVTLTANRTYVAIANGVLGSGFAANPDGAAISFQLFARDGLREKANWNQVVDLIAFHGATDAPTVDVRIRKGGKTPLFNDLTYGQFSAYRPVAARKYILDVTPGNDASTVVASFEADLNGLKGGAAVVFASGFLNPAANNNGPAFGLFAALPNGAVAALPVVVPTARLQVIHNAADPAAASVDIYVNDNLFENDFDFREATEFRTVPAGVQLNIQIAPGNSSSSAQAIATIPVTLEDGKTYVAIANGVLGSGFAANPDGRSISFSLFAKDGIRERASWFYRTDVIGFHGATDAPNVDIVARGWPFGPVVNNASYGDFGGYASLAPRTYVLDVTPGDDNNTVVASFEADLTGLNGGSAVVFASGFLNPAANNNGPAFGLFAALANGTVVAFPAYQATARLQVIHNAADPAASVVDVYVNDGATPLIDNFAFRTATPFIDVPAGVQLNLQIAPGNSSSSAQAIATIPVTLEANQTYVAIANGILGSGFAANPDGEDIGFKLFPVDGVLEEGRSRLGVNLIVFHGATDAPTVDVFARLGNFTYRAVNDLTYGEFSNYKFFFARNYTLTVTPGNSTTGVASFTADLSGLGGGAAVVFASGFLNPAANNNGPAFGLYAALPNGAVVALPAVAPSAIVAIADEEELTEGKIEELERGATALPTDFALSQNYPNPFNPTTTISFALPKSSPVTLSVYNILGQEVARLVDGPMAAGAHQVTFDAANMASGIYFYRLQTDGFSEQRKMVLMK